MKKKEGPSGTRKVIAFFRPPYSQARGSSPCAMVAIQTKKYSNLALDINVFQHTRPCLGSVSLKWSLLHRLVPYAELKWSLLHRLAPYADSSLT